MSKIVAFAAAWLVAALVALIVAWQGIGLVTRQVTARRPAPLTAGEIQARITPNQQNTDSASEGSVSGPTTTLRPAEPAVTTTARPATQGSTPTTSSVSQPTATTTTTARPQSTETTTATTAPSETRTYNLTGGSASLKFTPSGVTVQWATPHDGYEVKVEPENGNGVKVEFESDAHRSRVDAWWADGPQDRVREESH